MCNSSHPVGQPFDAEYLSQHSVHCSCWFSWSRKILNQCNVLSILHQYQWRCSLCFSKQAAIVWWMPQSLDHLWHLMLPGVKGGKGIATKLDCIQSFRMLCNLETLNFFGGDSTPFTKRSQHFTTASSEKISTIFLPCWFLKIKRNLNIHCHVLTSRLNVHTSNVKKIERQYSTSRFIIEISSHKYRFQ